MQDKIAQKHVFISYHKDDERSQDRALAHRVSYYLHKQTKIEVFCYEFEGGENTWELYVEKPLCLADYFILFAGAAMGESQDKEAQYYYSNGPANGTLINICLTQAGSVFSSTSPKSRHISVCTLNVKLDPRWECDLTTFDQTAFELAQAIYKKIHPSRDFVHDGLPHGYVFDYEKDIIDKLVDAKTTSLGIPDKEGISARELAKGTLLTWPEVNKLKSAITQKNPLDPNIVGEHRDDKVILVDPRGKYHHYNCAQPADRKHCLAASKLYFPEAGPRSKIAFPLLDKGKKTKPLRIGILVSGGIAPGINAVVEGIIDRHVNYAQAATNKYILALDLIVEGLSSVTTGIPGTETFQHNFATKDFPDDFQEMLNRVHDHSKLGGSIELRTSRWDSLLTGHKDRQNNLEEIKKNFMARPLDILYIIGGEGSMRAAHAIATIFRASSNDSLKNMHVIGIPKTMDNDILWVWQSFGFLSAVEKAKQFISQLHTEIRSNPRLCILQLFGSDSGFVVSHATLASGSICLAALIPEVPFTLRALNRYVCDRLMKNSETKKSNPYGLIVMAETAIPLDIDDHLLGPKATTEFQWQEVDAVREFTGSAFLKSTDIPDQLWDEFIRELLKPTGFKGAKPWMDSVASRLNNEVKKCLENASITLTPGLKSQLIELLNQNLIAGKPLTPDATIPRILDREPYKIFGPALENAIEACSKVNTINDLIMVGKNLIHLIALPYEAYWIIEHAKDYENLTKTQTLLIIEQFRKRIKERFNRMVIDSLFPQIRTYSKDQKLKRLQGQTNDALRSGGLKILTSGLHDAIRENASRLRTAKQKQYWTNYHVFCNQPRHLIRAIEPSCHDIIFTHRLGKLAVDGAMAGYSDFMISQWLTEYVLVPLALVVQGRKRVPGEGIFWKSVIASTKQSDLVY